MGKLFLLLKMKIMLHNEKGFTLLEAIFVLGIFLLIVSLSTLFLRPHSIQLEKQLFFSQLKADLLYAQQYALTNQKVVSVNFVNPEKFYYIRKQSGELLLRREYSNEIKVLEGSQKLFFRYHSNGNISSFGSIYFYIDGERYQMTFQLGRGRFYVMKS